MSAHGAEILSSSRHNLLTRVVELVLWPADMPTAQPPPRAKRTDLDPTHESSQRDRSLPECTLGNPERQCLNSHIG